MSSILGLNEIPTLSALYKLGRLTAAAASFASPNQTYNNKISLIRHDITKLRVDSIVNAANGSLLGGGGVDGAIHRAAGPRLLEECETLDGCDTGDAKITDAYRLPCKKIVHAVGPVYASAKRKGAHTRLLQGCYRRGLELAVQNGLKSIAFSAISTGVYGYPSGEAAETAIGEVKRFLESGEGDGLERIVFCNFMEKDESAYERWLPKIFPPTEADLESGDDAEEVGEEQKGPPESSKPLSERLPDVPKTDPDYEDAPDAKKQKRSHGIEEVDAIGVEQEKDGVGTSP